MRKKPMERNRERRQARPVYKPGHKIKLSSGILSAAKSDPLILQRA
jgi:hypothetical protein